MTGPADELRTALPGASILDRRSQTSLEHYRKQAQRSRRAAAVKRALLAHDTDMDQDARAALTRHAETLETDAAQWDALAAELEAFADQQAPDHGETLL